MGFDFKKIIPHIVVIVGFVVVSVAYFNPLLKGKVIFQSDIQQAAGMNSERLAFRKKHDKPTFWVDNVFGGMPTYLLGVHYPDEFVRSIDKGLRFLPRPADYLFLYFIGLYILFLVLKVDYKLAAVGALAFGFSTYLIIILGVGHNSKAQAIAYMPFVLAGIFAVFRKKYLWGGLLLTISLALEIFTGHYQMTYYLLLLVIIIGLVYAYKALKSKQFPRFLKSVGVMCIAAILALAANATKLMAAKEYTAWSTRGDTGLTITKNGNHKPEKGLTYDYITEYSYGLAETFNLFIPRFMGGANAETLGSDSHTYQYLKKMGAAPSENSITLPTYWGKQPIVAAPAYIGASLIFLFILALYLVKGRLKWWVVGGCILSISLSWGYNMDWLTRFFVNYVPFYNKFRTVASIQVLVELLVPFFAIYGLSKLFTAERNKAEKLHALKLTTIITGGICLFFLIFKSWLFDFSGLHDARYLKNLGPDFINALKGDRKALFTHDTLRSLILVLLCAAVAWGIIKEKLSKNWSIAIIAVLIVVDLVGIDRNYVNDDDFVAKSVVAKPFSPNAGDKQIMKDKSHFRVLDLTTNPMNSARASYFHNSIGGYHAAKPGRLQELYDFYIGEGHQGVINMMNIKYYILKNQGKTMAQLNPDANGNVWFVNEVEFVGSANEAILSLDSLNTKTTAVINKKFKDNLPQSHFSDHPGDTISLSHYQANRIVYDYSAQEERLAVFSEMYYPHGWQVKVDGKKLKMLQADYVLRAVLLPKGNHEVTFEFNPEIVMIGSGITLATGILLALLVLGGLYYTIKSPERKSIEASEKKA